MTVRAVRDLRERAQALVAQLDPQVMSADHATRLVREFVELERIAAAGKTVLAARASEGELWKRAGDQDAAHWLARKAGTSVAAAERTLSTSKQIRALDATRTALIEGDLSDEQAAAVSEAAAADPRCEQEMLRHAASDALHLLRERAESKKASADPDPEATRERIHRGRFAKKSRCADGAEQIHIRDNPDVIADIWARAQQYGDEIFEQARRNGVRDSHDNYMADAFAALAQAADPHGCTCRDGDTIRPTTSRKPLFILLGDLAAVVRGHSQPGETVEIPGFGPYPVDAARQLLHSDALVHLVLTHGTDPRCVVTDSRHIKTAVNTALRARDRRCVIPGCGRTAGLERHHTTSAQGFRDTQRTLLDELGLVCDFHHEEITHRGATLTGNHQDGWHYQPPPPENHGQPNPYARQQQKPPP